MRPTIALTEFMELLANTDQHITSEEELPLPTGVVEVSIPFAHLLTEVLTQSPSHDIADHGEPRLDLDQVLDTVNHLSLIAKEESTPGVPESESHKKCLVIPTHNTDRQLRGVSTAMQNMATDVSQSSDALALPTGVTAGMRPTIALTEFMELLANTDQHITSEEELPLPTGVVEVSIPFAHLLTEVLTQSPSHDIADHGEPRLDLDQVLETFSHLSLIAKEESTHGVPESESHKKCLVIPTHITDRQLRGVSTAMQNMATDVSQSNDALALPTGVTAGMRPPISLSEFMELLANADQHITSEDELPLPTGVVEVSIPFAHLLTEVLAQSAAHDIADHGEPRLDLDQVLDTVNHLSLIAKEEARLVFQKVNHTRSASLFRHTLLTDNCVAYLPQCRIWQLTSAKVTMLWHCQPVSQRA